VNRKELKTRIEDILASVLYNASVRQGVYITKPKIKITKLRRYYARITLDDKGGATLKVSDLFLKFYDKDKDLADRFLKFIIGHEIAHAIQKEKYGLGTFMYSHPLAIEEQANKIAENITDITYEEFKYISNKFRDIIIDEKLKTIKRKYPTAKMKIV